MRSRFLLVLSLGCLPSFGGCASHGFACADLLYSVFGDAYSAGGDKTDTGRKMDYDDKVRAISEPRSIPGASANPFSP